MKQNKTTISITTPQDIMWYFTRPNTKVALHNEKFDSTDTFTKRKDLAAFLSNLPENTELNLTFNENQDLLIS